MLPEQCRQIDVQILYKHDHDEQNEYEIYFFFFHLLAFFVYF